MPTYEYECKHCGYSFEVFQSMNDEPIKQCDKCGNEVRRLIFGGAGVIFKGSGFYVTDKGKGPANKAPRAESKTAETSSGARPAGDTKTDAAPAGNAASKDAGTKPAAQTA